MTDYSALLYSAIITLLKAGKKISEIYSRISSAKINYKSDNSPLTEADIASNKIIQNELSFFDMPVLSEESKQMPFEIRKKWEYLWIVDPLDGTKEFIKKNDEFTVNISLIKGNEPVLGVIYAPVLRTLYFGLKNMGSFKSTDIDLKNTNLTLEEIINISDKLPVIKNKDNFTIVASKTHLSKETEEYINNLKLNYGDIDLQSKGSSLKLCLIAEGTADLYPRLSPTMEWDIAAGDAIIRASGGKVINYFTGKNLLYNKEDLLNPWFIAEIN